MNVLVDSSVWSLALRRREPLREPSVLEFAELLKERRACIIGPIRQEVLSGIRHQEQFEKLREKLRFFPELDIESGDFEEAAALFNRCRAAGIQASNTDFLLCAVAKRLDVPILTTDQDFVAIADHCQVSLHRPRFASQG